MAQAREVASFGVATLFAGPVFVLAMAVTGAASTLGSSQDVAGLVGFMLLSIPFGAILAFLPIWLGVRLMTSLGRANVAMRLPVMWLLSGAAFGALIGMGANWNDTNSATPFMAVVGAACAGISRWFTRWED